MYYVAVSRAQGGPGDMIIENVIDRRAIPVRLEEPQRAECD